MRILYFSRDFSPHDHRFLSALANSPHEIFWLRLERRGRQLEDRSLPSDVNQIQWRGGKEPVRPRNGWALLGDLKRVIREVKPDLIHAGPVQSTAFLTAAAGYTPLVTMSWGSDLLRDAEKSRWMRWAARYTLKRTTVMAGDCQAVRDKAVELGFPSERCVLFPWGVDLQHFTPGKNEEFRERRGWHDKFVVLSMRSWEPVYGVDVLVRGFARAAQNIPELRLLLVGGGSQATLLREILARYEVLDRVLFAGQVKQCDLPVYYQAADLYVSASHSDGSSVSLMEALACGLPSLVSDIPGNREWITPGKQGWIFPDGDDQAVEGYIVQAYEQRNNLSALGAEARKLAEQRADWSQNSQKLLEAYQLAMAIHRSSKQKASA